MEAVANYNPSRGRLATFARHHIRGEILNYINTFRTSFHIPESLCRQINQYRAVRQKLGDDAATDTDIAKELGWSVETVQYVRECSEHQQMVSLDALQAAPGSDIQRSATLAVESRDLEEFEILHDLAVYLAQVPDREAEVICLRWGIGVRNPLSVSAIAELLGMSRSSVSRMEHDTFEKLRKLAQQEFGTGSFY